MVMRRLLRLLPALVVLAAMPACTDADQVFHPDITTTNFAAALDVNLAASTQAANGLWYRDLSVGGGAEVPATGGTRVTIQYTGWLRNGVEIDDGSYSFTTGAAGTIVGISEGVRGMRVGGVRQLIIPPDLGYGRNGTTGIPGQSILVFRVTLLSIG